MMPENAFVSFYIEEYWCSYAGRQLILAWRGRQTAVQALDH